MNTGFIAPPQPQQGGLLQLQGQGLGQGQGQGHFWQQAGGGGGGVEIPSIDIPDEDATSGAEGGGGGEGGAGSNQESQEGPLGEAEAADEDAGEDNEYGELPKALLANIALSLDSRFVYSATAIAPAIFDLQ